jgi:hypothetical protein
VVAGFTLDTRLEALPEAVRDQARRCIMVDDLAAA